VDLVAFAGAYGKILLILDQHFSSDQVRNSLFRGTLSLLAIARYMFELIVWLRTLEKDSSNGLLFRFRTVVVDLQHRRNSREQIQREVVRFAALAQEERDRGAQIINDKSLTKEQVMAAMVDLEREIDREARSQFSIYARQAASSSYDLAAQKMQAEILPPLDAQIGELELEKSELEASLIALRASSAWKWLERA
jgi:hypothetical protein